MIQVNDNFIKLPGNYLFSSIAKKVNAFKSAHPEAALIRLGIGDVTRPLPPASIKAMHRAVDELADAGTFHGYGPEQGYDFLIQAILEHDYRSRGVELRPTEFFAPSGYGRHRSSRYFFSFFSPSTSVSNVPLSVGINNFSFTILLIKRFGFPFVSLAPAVIATASFFSGLTTITFPKAP